MTQNLDLCIGCTGVEPLTSENTDLNVSGSGAYVNGYSESNGVITWSPVSTAITSNSTVYEGHVTGWTNYSDYIPYSGEGGDLYVYTSGSNNNDTIYTSKSDCETAHNDGSCQHYHVGNYYEVRLINSAIVSLNIDGYKISNPVGFKGSDVVIQFYTAFAPLIHVAAIEKVCAELNLDHSFATALGLLRVGVDTLAGAPEENKLKAKIAKLLQN